MSDPNYAHEFDPNREGLCKMIVSGRICHLQEGAQVHQRWADKQPTGCPICGMPRCSHDDTANQTAEVPTYTPPECEESRQCRTRRVSDDARCTDDVGHVAHGYPKHTFPVQPATSAREAARQIADKWLCDALQRGHSVKVYSLANLLVSYAQSRETAARLEEATAWSFEMANQGQNYFTDERIAAWKAKRIAQLEREAKQK